MREKVEGSRAESKISGKVERTRVSTETKANMGALDIAKGRYEAEAKEITQMAKYAIKAKAKVEAEGIYKIRSGYEARENVKA